MTTARGNRRSKQGTVVSNKMNKTVVVRVDRTLPHAKYGKIVRLSKKYYAHDESNELQVGDKVEIAEARPISKLKRWRVVGTW